MKKEEIKVGGEYNARISGRFVVVRVLAIRTDGLRMRMGGRSTASATRYDVENLTTKRKTTFRSAAKFRSVATNKTIKPMTSDERRQEAEMERAMMFGAE